MPGQSSNWLQRGEPGAAVGRRVRDRVCLESGAEASPLPCGSADVEINQKIPSGETPSWDTVQVT